MKEIVVDLFKNLYSRFMRLDNEHKGIYIITGGLMLLLQIVLLPLFFINIFIAILIYFSVWLIFIGLIILINDV